MVEKYEKDKNGRWVQSKQDDGKKKRKRVVRTILFIILILLLLLLLHYCRGRPKNTSGVQQGIIDLDREDAQDLVNQAVEDGMFQVFMNTAIVVDANNEAELLIQNSPNNHYSAYVEIHHGDELLYRSEVIAPGFKLERDTLRKDLDPGSYECEATFHVLDTETEEQINTIGLSVQIKKEM